MPRAPMWRDRREPTAAQSSLYLATVPETGRGSSGLTSDVQAPWAGRQPVPSRLLAGLRNGTSHGACYLFPQSGDGGFELFFEFWPTFAARFATCSRRTSATATCVMLPLICARRSSSSSLSRALPAARQRHAHAHRARAQHSTTKPGRRQKNKQEIRAADLCSYGTYAQVSLISYPRTQPSAMSSFRTT